MKVLTQSKVADGRTWRRILLAACAVGMAVATAACGFPPPPGIASDGPTSESTFQLLAVSPNVATAGDTVTLEGSFASTVTVNFPGGVSAAAVLLGDHRATVVVPPTASTGSLSVTTGGTTVGALSFRRASFAVGLQSFQSFYDQSAGAQQTPALTTARIGHTTAVIGRFLYVLGGSAGTGFLRSVERARINADGSLGPFATSDVSLVTARADHV